MSESAFSARARASGSAENKSFLVGLLSSGNSSERRDHDDTRGKNGASSKSSKAVRKGSGSPKSLDGEEGREMGSSKDDRGEGI